MSDEQEERKVDYHRLACKLGNEPEAQGKYHGACYLTIEERVALLEGIASDGSLGNDTRDFATRVSLYLQGIGSDIPEIREEQEAELKVKLASPLVTPAQPPPKYERGPGPGIFVGRVGDDDGWVTIGHVRP